MKRKAVAIISLISILFCLVACSVPEEKPEETKDTLVANPLVKDRLNRIQIATADMSVQQLRQICVDFMRLQISFGWTPNTEFVYQNKTKTVTVPVGKVIGGMPYISLSGGSIYNFMHFYNEEDGTFDAAAAMSLTQPYMKVIANQCSGSTYWAWARVSNCVKYKFTSTILPANGCIPVGSYYIDPAITNFTLDGVRTQDICTENGRQVMFDSYAKLRMADGVFQHNSSGHVQMVALDATVVYKADGSIDGEKSYVTLMDQDSSFKEKTQSNGKPISNQGGLDKKYTFENLYSKGYLPFTIPEFVGEDPIEKAEVSANLPKDGVSAQEITGLTVQANYPMSYVTIAVKNKKGEELYRNHIYTLALNVYEFAPINPEYLHIEELTAFGNGLHTIEISVKVGTGETLTAYSGVFKS